MRFSASEGMNEWINNESSYIVPYLNIYLEVAMKTITKFIKISHIIQCVHRDYAHQYFSNTIQMTVQMNVKIIST